MPEHIELGTVSSEQVVAEFKIENGLEVPVRILHVYPSCRCTSVDLSCNPVPAGGGCTLKAFANLNNMAGKQDFAVSLITDCEAFPEKRLSFTAVVKSSGTIQRRTSIGHFYSNQKIEYVLPLDAISTGKISGLKCVADSPNDWKFSTHLENGNLIIKGVAPKLAGVFKSKLLFTEDTGIDGAGESNIQLQLSGNVVKGWDFGAVILGGFVETDSSQLQIAIKQIPSGIERIVQDISIKGLPQWLILEKFEIQKNEMQLLFRIDRAAIPNTGALRAEKIRIEIKNLDGNTEEYVSDLNFHVS